MSSFADAFIRPLAPAVSVAGFLFAGGARWAFCVAAAVGMYCTSIEIQRASHWGRR